MPYSSYNKRILDIFSLLLLPAATIKYDGMILICISIILEAPDIYTGASVKKSITCIYEKKNDKMVSCIN
jgi:hypothetical protein